MACDDSDGDRQKITRRRGACQLCREKKVRCNGRKPCSFCEKHQATCVYQPTATKPPSQALASSQHTRNPGPTGRSRHDSAVNIDCSETGDLEHPTWSDVTELGGFDEGLNLMGFPFSPSAADTERLIDPGLLKPSTPPSTSNTAAFDVHEFDWSFPAEHQDDAVTTAESGSRGLEQIVGPSPARFSLDSSESVGWPTAGLGSPVKRRRLSSLTSTPVLTTPILEKGARLKSVLFPTSTSVKASSTNNPSSYNPYVSALFPSPRRVESKAGESRKSTVTRVVTRLLSRDYLLGLPTSWADSLADYLDSEAHHLLENSSVLPVEKLVYLCFDEPWGVSCFLNKSDVLTILQREKDPDAIPLTDIFLVGIVTTWGATINTDEHHRLICAMTTHLMDLRHAVSLEPDSISKFLALVAMLQYSFKAGLTQTPVVLAETVSVAQSMNLHLEAGLEGVGLDGPSTNQVKRACWALFCVDKVYAMRWRTFSLLPDIEYDLPPFSVAGSGSHEPYPSHDQDSQEKDWLLSQCRYAQICARINRGFASSSSATITAATAHDESDNSITAERRTPTPQEDPRGQLVRSLLTELHAWYESVPREGRPLSLAKAAASTSSQRHIAISTAYQYHEAVLAVLSQLPPSSTLDLSQSAISPGTTSCSVATVFLESIKGVLTLSNHVSDFLDDRTLLHVPTLVLCTLAVEHVKGNPVLASVPLAQRECRALFAMAYGFFGRLAGTLPHNEFFDRVAELFEAVNGL